MDPCFSLARFKARFTGREKSEVCAEVKLSGLAHAFCKAWCVLAVLIALLYLANEGRTPVSDVTL